jgi:hypothetical protein
MDFCVLEYTFKYYPQYFTDEVKFIGIEFDKFEFLLKNLSSKIDLTEAFRLSLHLSETSYMKAIIDCMTLKSDKEKTFNIFCDEAKKIDTLFINQTLEKGLFLMNFLQKNL